jgi:site-specific DNA-cytosine methylase
LQKYRCKLVDGSVSRPYDDVYAVLHDPDFCRTSGEEFIKTDITIMTWPCQPFCQDTNNESKRDFNNPMVRAWAQKCFRIYYENRVDITWWENVAAFRKSQAWQIVQAAMQGKHTVYEVQLCLKRDLNLPQTRNRWYCITKQGSMDLKEIHNVLLQELEVERQTKLTVADCIIGDQVLLKRVGVTDKVLQELGKLTPSQQANLDVVTQKLIHGGDDEYYVFDIGQSKDRLTALAARHPEANVCPCITSSNSFRRLWCTKIKRFLLPQELMLMHGFEMPAIIAANVVIGDATDLKKKLRGLARLGRMVGQSASPALWRVFTRVSARLWPSILCQPSAPIVMNMECHTNTPANMYTPPIVSPIMCGSDNFLPEHCINFRNPSAPCGVGNAKLWIGNGLELRWTPDYGEGHVGVFATRTLYPKDWTWFEGLLCPSSTPLLHQYKSHALSISEHSKKLLGPRPRPGMLIEELNKGASGMGAGSFVNAAPTGATLNNAKRITRNAWKTLLQHHNGGGAEYYALGLATEPELEDVIGLHVSKQIEPGDQVHWAYTMADEPFGK